MRFHHMAVFVSDLDEALRLWDAVEVLARSGVAEIKRSLRDKLDFT